MRPIKFRAWDKASRILHDRLKIKFGRKGTMVLVGTTDNEQERWVTIPNQNVELMQFTGLLDKNSVEIYEGDICKDENQDIWKVEFLDGSYWFVNTLDKNNRNTYDWLKDNNYWGKYEVIGNIYENSKLIN